MTSKEGYTSPADVWAAGVIFYMMLAGTTPWEDDAVYSLGKTVTVRYIFC